MKPTKITKDQLVKVAKAALYSAISAVLATLLLFTTDNEIVVAGLVITPLINTLLVTLKQLFTLPEEK